MKISKMFVVLAVASMTFSVCSLKADETNSAVRPANEVAGYNCNFEHVPVSKVLDIYAQLAGVELKNEEQIPAFGGINFKTAKPLTHSEIVQALEKVLREQAGVVFKPLDAKHIEATYDEPVKIKN